MVISRQGRRWHVRWPLGRAPDDGERGREAWVQMIGGGMGAYASSRGEALTRTLRRDGGVEGLSLEPGDLRSPYSSSSLCHPLAVPGKNRFCTLFLAFSSSSSLSGILPGSSRASGQDERGATRHGHDEDQRISLRVFNSVYNITVPCHGGDARVQGQSRGAHRSRGAERG